MPRQARLGGQRTLHPVNIRGMEERPILADHLDGVWFFSCVGQWALERGTKICARFLMDHDAPILL